MGVSQGCLKNNADRPSTEVKMDAVRLTSGCPLGSEQRLCHSRVAGSPAVVQSARLPYPSGAEGLQGSWPIISYKEADATAAGEAGRPAGMRINRQQTQLPSPVASIGLLQKAWPR